MRQKSVFGCFIAGILLLGIGIMLSISRSDDKPVENSQVVSTVETSSIVQQVTQEEVQIEEFQTEEIQQDVRSLYQFLQNAMKPVGGTMYIWGGGWNKEDTGAGVSATYIGLYPKWKNFADKQDEDYNHKEYRYELENGLDCSGFVGWTVYNTFETENGKDGYVVKAKKMAAYFADKGWGHFIENPKTFLPGDIVSMEKHVWICLGTCEDGSILLVHASPPGVSVCGTKGKAAELAKTYMTSEHPDWQAKYPKREVGASYTKDVTLFRWTDAVMTDVKEVQSLTGEEVIEYLLEENK